jgi:hypothetical protein
MGDEGLRQWGSLVHSGELSVGSDYRYRLEGRELSGEPVRAATVGTTVLKLMHYRKIALKNLRKIMTLPNKRAHSTCCVERGLAPVRLRAKIYSIEDSMH